MYLVRTLLLVASVAPVALVAAVTGCAGPESQTSAPPVVAKSAGSKSSSEPASSNDVKLAVSVPTFENPTCPIMGKPVSDKLYVETPKGRVYVCCKSCNKPILEDVDKAIETAYPTVKKASISVCPIMGDEVSADSPSVVLQGVAIQVCCKDCIERVKANDQIVLALVNDPKLVDLKNETCPITGQPVADNAFCVIGAELVHLSSRECVDAVKKDPAAALAKAKADAAARAADKSKG